MNNNNIWDTLIELVRAPFGWVDKIFAYFGLYTQGYSKYLVYGFLIFVLSKILKIKVNIDTKKS